MQEPLVQPDGHFDCYPCGQDRPAVARSANVALSLEAQSGPRTAKGGTEVGQSELWAPDPSLRWGKPADLLSHAHRSKRP